MEEEIPTHIFTSSACFMQFSQQQENSSKRQTVLQKINQQLSLGAMMLHDRPSSLTEAAAWCSIINSLKKAQLTWIKCLYLLLSSMLRFPHNPPASSGSPSGSGDFCPFCCSRDVSFLHMMLSSANFKGFKGPLWPCPYNFQQSVWAMSLSLCNTCLCSICSTFTYYSLQILVTLPAVIAPGIILNYLCCHK